MEHRRHSLAADSDLLPPKRAEYGRAEPAGFSWVTKTWPAPAWNAPRVAG
jgi:hypothetical protein